MQTQLGVARCQSGSAILGQRGRQIHPLPPLPLPERTVMLNALVRRSPWANQQLVKAQIQTHQHEVSRMCLGTGLPVVGQRGFHPTLALLLPSRRPSQAALMWRKSWAHYSTQT
jgi:hypothetical protein